jgi:hypothetical protein
MSTATNRITFTKLRDGSWGLRGLGLVAGTTVTVTKRSGQTKRETVGRVMWTGDDGLSIASIASARRASRSYGSYDDEYCGYPCPVTGRKCGPAHGPCHDCE